MRAAPIHAYAAVHRLVKQFVVKTGIFASPTRDPAAHPRRERIGEVMREHLGRPVTLKNISAARWVGVCQPIR